MGRRNRPIEINEKRDCSVTLNPSGFEQEFRNLTFTLNFSKSWPESTFNKNVAMQTAVQEWKYCFVKDFKFSSIANCNRFLTFPTANTGKDGKTIFYGFKCFH